MSLENQGCSRWGVSPLCWGRWCGGCRPTSAALDTAGEVLVGSRSRACRESDGAGPSLVSLPHVIRPAVGQAGQRAEGGGVEHARGHPPNARSLKRWGGGGSATAQSGELADGPGGRPRVDLKAGTQASAGTHLRPELSPAPSPLWFWDILGSRRQLGMAGRGALTDLPRPRHYRSEGTEENTHGVTERLRQGSAHALPTPSGSPSLSPPCPRSAPSGLLAAHAAFGGLRVSHPTA